MLKTDCHKSLNLAIQNDAMVLNWSTNNAGVSFFNLQKAPGAPISVAAGNSSYSDTDVNCGTSYSYQLISDYGSGIRSLSKTVSGIAVSTTKPAPITNTSVQLDGTSASLT